MLEESKSGVKTMSQDLSLKFSNITCSHLPYCYKNVQVLVGPIGAKLATGPPVPSSKQNITESNKVKKIVMITIYECI